MLAFSQANHSSSCVQEKLWLLLSTVTVWCPFWVWLVSVRGSCQQLILY
jgi:hypothetical protein